jgi:hypothetical protein
MRHPLPRRLSPWPAALLTLLLLAPSARRAAAQVEVGPNDFRISFVEGTGDPDFDAFDPAVAFNPVANEFLVVWQALHAPAACGPGFTGELEIFAQRIDASTGALLGAPVTVSDAGPPCDGRFEPADPAVDFNPGDEEYLVVWSGDDSVGGLVDNEMEIFGQRLTASGAEIGADDFRISAMGGTGDPAFDATVPAVAFNPVAEQYLVVWSGDHDAGGLVDGEQEIFGRLLVANGVPVGGDFRISDAGGTGDQAYDADDPDVVYQPATGEYLVVWNGDDDVGGLVVNELEVFGQRLDGSGAEIGANDFRISEQGGTGDATLDALFPDVAVDPQAGRYLVVWQGDDDGPFDGHQAYAQLLGPEGEEVDDEVRISDMGSDGTSSFEARFPAALYNAAAGEYLIVWYGVDDDAGLALNENEIFGQRLDPTGGEVGANDFRISDMGPDGEPDFDGIRPDAVAGVGAQLLVVWQGDDDVGGLVDNEIEIFGQLVIVPLFADGFEAGDTSGWTQTVP